MHGGDKKRGGESGKWCVKAMKELKVGVVEKGKGKESEVVEVVGKDGKTYKNAAREKVRILHFFLDHV